MSPDQGHRLFSHPFYFWHALALVPARCRDICRLSGRVWANKSTVAADVRAFSAARRERIWRARALECRRAFRLNAGGLYSSRCRFWTLRTEIKLMMDNFTCWNFASYILNKDICDAGKIFVTSEQLFVDFSENFLGFLKFFFIFFFEIFSEIFF